MNLKILTWAGLSALTKCILESAFWSSGNSALLLFSLLPSSDPFSDPYSGGRFFTRDTYKRVTWYFQLTVNEPYWIEWRRFVYSVWGIEVIPLDWLPHPVWLHGRISHRIEHRMHPMERVDPHSEIIWVYPFSPSLFTCSRTLFRYSTAACFAFTPANGFPSSSISIASSDGSGMFWHLFIHRFIPSHISCVIYSSFLPLV